MKKVLTGFVIMALWRAAEKNGSTHGRIAYQLIKQKRSRLEQNNLLMRIKVPRSWWDGCMKEEKKNVYEGIIKEQIQSR